jgi:cyclopropane fatty-acyl-phospholipid synthase-like methyltransferase
VSNQYTEDFYQNQKQGSRRSAEQIVPLVLELVQPRSIVDIGCGLGTWLAVFIQHGIVDVLGVDGDYVERNMLQIGEDRFVAHDLTKPIRLDSASIWFSASKLLNILPKSMRRRWSTRS